MKRHDDYNENNRILLYFGIGMMTLIVLIVMFVFSENTSRKSNSDGFNKAKQQAMQREGISEQTTKTNEFDFSHNTLTADDLDIWTLPPTGRTNNDLDENDEKDEKQESDSNKDEKPIEKEIDVSVLENIDERTLYSPTDFKLENGVKTYFKDGKAASKHGVEISWKQGNVNMKRIRNSGCDFVLLNVGNRGYASGNIVMDDMFQKNIDAALSAGLQVGVIFTSQAANKDEILEEADVVLTAVRGYKLSLPVFMKIEVVEDEITRTDGLSKDELTDLCNYFIREINDSGYDAGIYASSIDLKDVNFEELPECEIILSEVGEAPAYKDDFTYWQYDNASFNGITNKANLIIKFE